MVKHPTKRVRKNEKRPRPACYIHGTWQIVTVREALDLSYKSSDKLNQIIDTNGHNFQRDKVMQSGEVLEFYTCNIIECLHALWGDPDFEGDLILELE
jgi:hypothetical protein